MKKIILLIVVLIGLLGGAYFYLRQNKPTKTQSPSQQNKKVSTLEVVKDPKYKNFNLEGKITSISSQTMAFEASVIKDGMPLKLSKIANLTDQPAIVIRTKTAKGFQETRTTLKDISVGQTVTFFTQTYPYDTAPITPYRIEILK
ncbi:MAG TPA: hypothetical protein VF974_05775 [Patescibacteria group bacterium]